MLFDSIELDRTTPQSRASLPASSLADHFFLILFLSKNKQKFKNFEDLIPASDTTSSCVCSRNIQHFNLHNTGTVVSNNENTHHATSTSRTSSASYRRTTTSGGTCTGSTTRPVDDSSASSVSTRSWYFGGSKPYAFRIVLSIEVRRWYCGGYY